MNDIFSSRLFAAKLDLSRKLRVDIGSDEKNECEGSDDEVSRLVECRVIKAFSIARWGLAFAHCKAELDIHTL